MIAYILRRVLYAVPIALSVSLVCFMLVHIAPGDPIAAIVPPNTPPEVVAHIRQEYGLDRPLPVQFGLWLGQALHGNLGTSIATGRPVWSDLSVAIHNTLVLALAASSIGFLFGCLLGGVAGAFRGGWIDRGSAGVAAVGISIPNYWLGMGLVIVFSVMLNWLPAMGAGADGSTGWDRDHLLHIILPAVTLSIIPMGITARTVRGMVIEVLGQDFITMLRGKGMRRFGVFWHVVKNAAPNALAVMGLQLGYLMGGSILVETVFSWPGTGLLLNNAIFQRDIPVLQGTILVLSMFFVTLNLLVDLAQALLDPRVSRR